MSKIFTKYLEFNKKNHFTLYAVGFEPHPFYFCPTLFIKTPFILKIVIPHPFLETFLTCKHLTNINRSMTRVASRISLKTKGSQSPWTFWNFKNRGSVISKHKVLLIWRTTYSAPVKWRTGKQPHPLYFIPTLFINTPFILKILWTPPFWRFWDFPRPTLSKACTAYSVQYSLLSPI